MKKRGQLISFDLVLGILVLIVGIIFSLTQIDRLYPRSDLKLNLQPDFVFNNLELNLKNKRYAASTGFFSFIDNFKIDDSQLINFDTLSYDDSDGNDFNDMKSIAIKTLDLSGLNLNFCLYFEDKDGNIVTVNGKSGIGFSSLKSEIYVAKKVECNSIIPAVPLLKAVPDCSDYYTHAINFFKPVVRQKKVMKMNILICGRAEK